VYEFLASEPSPSASGNGRAIPIASADASHGRDVVAGALDGRIDTRWTSGKPQTGDEWLRIRFAAPQNVAAAVFRVSANELGDYPRRLEIDGERGGVAESAPSGSYMFAFGAALRRAPEDIRVRVPIASDGVDGLRFRQTGRAAGPWWWSIDELTVEAKR
jgi:hypothetical protein